MRAILAFLLISGLTACGSQVPESGILGSYAKAYDTNLIPKIKDLELDGSSARDIDSATRELNSFKAKFLDSLTDDEFLLKDEPCVFHEWYRRCWQIIGEYAFLISFDPYYPRSEYTDSDSEKKLFNGDTILLSVAPNEDSTFASCFLIDGELGEDAIFRGRYIAANPKSYTTQVCDLANSAHLAGVPKSKLKNVKVAIALEKMTFTSARLACSESDCVEEQVRIKNRK